MILLPEIYYLNDSTGHSVFLADYCVRLLHKCFDALDQNTKRLGSGLRRKAKSSHIITKIPVVGGATSFFCHGTGGNYSQKNRFVV